LHGKDQAVRHRRTVFLWERLMTGASVRLIEHTADIGLEVRATTLAELFRQAALGLLQVLEPLTPARPLQARPVSLSGSEPAELLVGWLNEILFWLETRRLLPAEFEVRELSDRRLRGVIRGEPLVPKRHRLQREVKAATWHQLQLQHQAEGWFARIYLDL